MLEKDLQTYLHNYTLYEYSMRTIDSVLKENIVKIMEEKGRKDYDAPHTRNVVDYTKKIIELNHQKVGKFEGMYVELDESFLPINPIVLLITAYAHDWAYVDLLENSAYIDMKEKKTLHMSVGAKKIHSFLTDIKYFHEKKLRESISILEGLGVRVKKNSSIKSISPFWFLEDTDWISQIVDLVRVHDDFEEFSQDQSTMEYWHQRIFMMADTLGMLKPIEGSEVNFESKEIQLNFLGGVEKYRLPLFLDNLPEFRIECVELLLTRRCMINDCQEEFTD
jgi:hypothetical protein